jgi:hypothetical protein
MAVGSAYEEKTGRKPEIYVLAPSDGAKLVNQL